MTTPDAVALPRAHAARNPLRLLGMLAWLSTAGGLAQVGLATLAPESPPPASGPDSAWAMLRFMAQVFVFHAGIAMLPVLLLALATRRWALATSALIVLGVGAGPELARSVRPDVSAGGGGGLKIVSFNIQYGGARPEAIMALLERERPDVVLFQEWTPGGNRALSSGLRERWPHAFEAARDDAFGQAVFSSRPMTSPLRVYPPGSFREPQITIEVEHRGAPARICNVHLLPPVSAAMFGEQRRAAQSLAAWAAQRSATSPDVFMGDFNATARTGVVGGLLDVGYVEAHAAAGRGRGATWPKRGSLRFVPGIRIDQALVGPGWRVLEARVGEDVGSDHRPVIVVIDRASP